MNMNKTTLKTGLDLVLAPTVCGRMAERALNWGIGRRFRVLYFAIKALMSLAIASLVLVLSTTSALADNLLSNPGFELNPPASIPANNGNNIGHSVAPWILGPGDNSNVVKVDGPAGFNYGTNGPESDRAAPGQGIEQHYLDIADGSNDFYQSFTVSACSSVALIEYEVSGSFSARGTGTAIGSIRILNGTGLGGTVVTPEPGASLSVTTSDNVNWTDASGFYQLTPGNDYTYAVSLNNPANFDEASLSSGTFVCENITAVNDDFTATPIPSLGGTTSSVFLNDTFNDLTPTSSTVDVTLTDLDGLTGVTINANGTIDIPASPSGDYTFTYEFCESGSTTNCATAIVDVTIEPAGTNNITGSQIQSCSYGELVEFDNSSSIVFTAAPSNSRLFTAQSIQNGSTFDFNVLDQSPAAYPLETPISGTAHFQSGGTATAGGIRLLGANGDLGRADVTVNISNGFVTEMEFFAHDVEVNEYVSFGALDYVASSLGVFPGATVNVDEPSRTLIASAGDTSGQSDRSGFARYSNINGLTSLTQTAQIPVGRLGTGFALGSYCVSIIDAKPEVFSDLNGVVGDVTETVLASDTLNGVTVVPAEVTLTPGDITGPDGNPSTAITLNANGTITAPAGTPAGDYTVEYEICDNVNTTNCSTVVETVTVTNPLNIIATDDSYNAPVEATGAIGFMNVLSDNGGGVDTLDGAPATDATVTITAVGTLPAGVTLNPDGSVDVVGASEGVTSFDYEICQVGLPTNCDTATVIFTVLDMSGTGLVANPQVCVSPLATYTGGASGTLSAGAHSSNYSASVTALSGFSGSSFDVGSGDSLIGTLALDNSVNPDSFTATYTLSAVTSPSHVIRLYGGRGLPGGGTGGDNQAAEITLSWTGGTGNATYYDPVTPSAAMYRYAPDADFDLNQREIFGADTTGGVSNGGKFRVYNVFNANSEWYVDFPRDATSVTITKVTLFDTSTTTDQGNDSLLPLLGRANAGSGEAFNEWITFSTLLCQGKAVLTAEKQVSVWDPLNAGLYLIPGNDVIYSISATNTGTGPTDADSIVLIDAMPPEIKFYNGDIDDGGPEINPVSFSQSTGAGLTFDYANDLGYWNGPIKPVDFSGCSYVPVSGYDSNVTYICFNPKGELAADDPDPSFEFKFRARIE